MSDEQNEPGPGIRLTNVEQFERPMSDQDRAGAHKMVIREILLTLVDAIEDARRDGFFTEFNVNPGPYGAYSLQALNLVKRF